MATQIFEVLYRGSCVAAAGGGQSQIEPGTGKTRAEDDNALKRLASKVRLTGR